MKQNEFHGIERLTTVAVVAPVRLQDAYGTFLRAIPEVKLVACAATAQALLTLVVEQSPDLVLLEADGHDTQASDQVRRIKTVWPTARCIVLVEHTRQRALVQAAGAEVALLRGASPKRLLEVISKLRSADKSGAIDEEN
jgi:DNA-binding NarL/FixJ family response regulator